MEKFLLTHVAYGYFDTPFASGIKYQEKGQAKIVFLKYPKFMLNKEQNLYMTYLGYTKNMQSFMKDMNQFDDYYQSKHLEIAKTLFNMYLYANIPYLFSYLGLPNNVIDYYEQIARFYDNNEQVLPWYHKRTMIEAQQLKKGILPSEINVMSSEYYLRSAAVLRNTRIFEQNRSRPVLTLFEQVLERYIKMLLDKNIDDRTKNQVETEIADAVYMMNEEQKQLLVKYFATYNLLPLLNMGLYASIVDTRLDDVEVWLQLGAQYDLYSYYAKLEELGIQFNSDAIKTVNHDLKIMLNDRKNYEVAYLLMSKYPNSISLNKEQEEKMNLLCVIDHMSI